MKSKLSNRGYVIQKKFYSDQELKDIKNKLTVAPFNAYKSNFTTTPTFKTYLESINKLYLPRIWGINNLGPPEKFSVNEGVNIDLKFNGSLRDIQKDAKNAYLNNCNDLYGSGTICLLCGQGKTICSLNIVAHLKKKALVIVHKEFLLNQWIERIKTFLPDAQIGRIQGKIFDIAGKDIVIAMLQSLSMKDYDEEAFSSFGTTVVDECFIGSTLIYTTEGLQTIEYLYNSWKNNSKLPYIYSYNKETGLFENKKLTYGWRKTATKLLEITVSDITIICTNNHKILTNEGYIKAIDLNIEKHKIYTLNNTIKLEQNIQNIKNIVNNEDIYVYDIEVEDNHNYIVTNKNINTLKNGIIVSNCHHISSEVFSKALPKVSTKYTLGLTATPNRADGLTKVFNWFLGDIVYKGTRKTADNVYIKSLCYKDDNPAYCKMELGYDNKPVTSRMINNVANYLPRTDLILETTKKVMEEEGRKMLILSDRRDHLKLMYAKLEEMGYDIGFYLGGMKQKDLDISETKAIILGTFSMSSEALDIPELNTLFMTTPKSNIEQSVGRILRKKHEIRALIIDIKDNFAPFMNQYKKRCAFYKKCKYQVEEFEVDNNNYKTVLEENKLSHTKIVEIEDKPSKKKTTKKQLNIDECLLSDDD